MVWQIRQDLVVGGVVKGETVWALARRQHGVATRRQLLALGLSPRAIEHRVAKGRLFRLDRGVYAVGRRELNRQGWWLAAVLASGTGAVLSHRSAAALWGFGREEEGLVELTARTTARLHPRIWIRRCARPKLDDVVIRREIPVTTPIRTFIDLAAAYEDSSVLERAISEADRLGVINPDTLRAALSDHRGQHGVPALRLLLDANTFRLTDSELERRFLRLVSEAGLPLPLTGHRLNGFLVDFYWPDLGLVVETDGIRYHRTPAQQARDRRRDQAHTAAGFTQLRFTHAQVTREQNHVRRVLTSTAERLRREWPSGPPGRWWIDGA
jgi:very-short-patch-repair endonuclease